MSDEKPSITDSIRTFAHRQDALAYMREVNTSPTSEFVLVQGPIGDDEPLIADGDFRWAVMNLEEALDNDFAFTREA